MTYVYSFLLGGMIVTLSTFFSRNGRPDCAGMIMLFPAITIATLLTTENSAVMNVAKWGMLGLAGAAIFLGVFIGMNYIFGTHMKHMNLFVSFMVWIAVFAVSTKLGV